MIGLDTNTHQAHGMPSEAIPSKMDVQSKDSSKFTKIDTQRHLLKIAIDPEKFKELYTDPLTDFYWKKRLSLRRKPGLIEKNNTTQRTKAPTGASRCCTHTIHSQVQPTQLCPILPPPKPKPYHLPPKTETPTLKKQSRFLTRAATPPPFLNKTISSPNELESPAESPSKVEPTTYSPIILKVLGSQAILTALTAGSYYFLSKRVNREEEDTPTEDFNHSKEDLRPPLESQPISQESLSSPQQEASETNKSNDSIDPTSETEESSPSSSVVLPQISLNLPFSIEQSELPTPIDTKQISKFCPASYDLLYSAYNSTALTLGGLKNPPPLPTAEDQIDTTPASVAPAKLPIYLLTAEPLISEKGIHPIIKDILIRFPKNSYPLQFPTDLTGKPICPIQMPKQISLNFLEMPPQDEEGAPSSSVVLPQTNQSQPFFIDQSRLPIPIDTKQPPKFSRISYDLLHSANNSTAPMLTTSKNPTPLPSAELQINTTPTSAAPVKPPTYLLTDGSLIDPKTLNFITLHQVIRDILIRFPENSYPPQFLTNLKGKRICQVQISSDLLEMPMQVFGESQEQNPIYLLSAISLAACALLTLYFLVNNNPQENHPTFGNTLNDKSDEEQVNECIYQQTIDQFNPRVQEIIQRFTRQLQQELEELRSIPKDQRRKFHIKPDGHLEQIH